MSEKQYGIEDLRYLMARLRHRETGCPWDVQQDFRSLTPYMLEEAYEVVDAIEREDQAHFPEELGDLLFQVIFHSQMAAEQGLFAFDDIVHTLTEKLVRRHPHVFPDGTLASQRRPGDEPATAEINQMWEEKKQGERHAKGHRSALADVPTAFPALTRAQKIQKRASKVGFDWSQIDGVFDKIREEIDELEAEIPAADSVRLEDELGDLLFAMVNLSRHLKLDAESCLRRATQKFERRFQVMESLVDGDNNSLEQMTDAQLDHLWQRAKQQLAGR